MSISTAVEEPVPLTTDDQGVIRVDGTRVRLDTIVAAFDTGASAEEIAADYPLQLDDVYAVITYYLRHQEDVRTYLDQRRQHTRVVRLENAQRFNQRGLRERLLARLQPATS